LEVYNFLILYLDICKLNGERYDRIQGREACNGLDPEGER
jgi:hypothetical protein